MYKNHKIAVVMPALNEEASIANVIHALWALHNADQSAIVDKIVVCDNNSSDTTVLAAEAKGAHVVHEAQRGYGAACQTAISVLEDPDIVVFVDADRSVVVDELQTLLEPIIDGNDLVIGSRALGRSVVGALTPQQRLGNIFATCLIRWLWQKPVTDLGPFRAIRHSCLKQLNMQDRRYGWTVEMQVKAIQHELKIVEKPVTSVKRIGKSKISGTVYGTFAAGKDIIGTIVTLWGREKKQSMNKFKRLLKVDS